MQKKIMAVAVAGALAAPAAALAQTTVYGLFIPSVEMRSATGADASLAPATNQSSVRGGTLGGAYSATPANLQSRTSSQSAGSNFGIRVREDLGGGTYAGGQVELGINIGNMTPGSNAAGGYWPTTRNTAANVGGNWGEVKMGIWDTPWAVNGAANPAHAGYALPSTSFAAGLLGSPSWNTAVVSSMSLAGYCAGTVANAALATFPASAATCMGTAMTFVRREPNTVQYWSPVFSGVQIKFMYGEEILKQASNATPTVLKPSMYSASVVWEGMGARVGLGYQEHKDFTAFAARTLGSAAYPAASGTIGGAGTTAAMFSSDATTSKDTAVNVHVNYTFAGAGITLGAYYEQLKWTVKYNSTTAGNVESMDRPAYRVDAVWRGGPHLIGVQYAASQKIDATLSGGNTWNGDQTGMKGVMVGYAYYLSKRTQVGAYATMITNETNAKGSGIVFGGLAPAAGADPKYYGLAIRHAF